MREYIHNQTIKRDVTEEFLKVADKYYKNEITSMVKAGELLGVSPSWFITNYKIWLKDQKKEEKKPKSRWLNDDGALNEFAKTVYNDYIVNGLTLKEVYKKYNVGTAGFYGYIDKYYEEASKI